MTGHAMVTMIYHKKLGLDWQEAAKKLRPVLGSCPSSTRPFVDIIGRSHKQKVELETGFVCETLSVDGHEFIYKQVGCKIFRPLAGPQASVETSVKKSVDVAARRMI